MSVYEHFIDTFEFAHPIEQINVLYEVYVKQKKWYGKLNEIILGYKGEEDSRFILPTFAEIRSGCRKRCIYDQNCSCQICNRIASLGESLENEGIIITRERQGEDNEKQSSTN